MGAQTTDLIRGRVIGPDKQPIANATVTATSLVSQTSRVVKTGSDGRFTIVFAGNDGDYLVSYTAVGFNPYQHEIKREVDEDVLVADAQMGKAAVVLEAVRVNAGRELPDRNGNAQDIGGHEQTINMNNVPIDAMGDLAAMAATLPGVTLIPGADGSSNGFSVLGLTADQNNITLNGLNISNTDLPRDATSQVRVATSTFDPSRGGFSGAQISLRTTSGTNYIQQNTHVTVDAPSLQYTDATGRLLGQQFTNLQASGSMSGPIELDKAFYSFSYQFGQRTSDLQSLLINNPAALERAGISADSANEFRNTLTSLYGLPLSTAEIPSSNLTRNGSFLTNFDFSPTGTHNFTFTVNGRWRDQGGSALSAAALPVHGADNRSYGGTVQARHSSYFGSGFLDETNASFQDSWTQGTPYVNMPSGNVRVTSMFPDTSAATSTLLFGGNTRYPSSTNTASTEVQNTISWISLDNEHRFKFMVDGQYHVYGQDNTTNRYGTYTYNSLTALDSNTPASFTRRLNVNRRIGDDYTASASLGDAFRITPRLQLTYGARVDASHFNGAPAFNPALDSLLDVRNDNVPRGVFVSPRLGFSWRYGTGAQVEGFQGAARGSLGQLSGGIGQFQNLASSQLIAAAVDQTGLANAAQQLTCIGSAVPIPNWDNFAANVDSIPTACAPGSPSQFATTVPNVSLFDKDYTPQRSWRANLAWNVPILNNRFRFGVNGTYSLNLNQQDNVDLNFNDQNYLQTGQSDFTIAGGRPVFVPMSSIVPSTGQTSLNASRVTNAFAQVTDYKSDLTSHSTQFQFSFAPVAFNSSFTWNITYVWQKITDLTRGFNGTTSGDPLAEQWARSNGDARHQINYSLAYTIKQAVTLTAFGRVQSGNPFTPIVQGDINGDGNGGNDRAFIYDPSSTAATNANVAAGMQSLLANAPKSIQDCLRSQLGTIATRNSCEGPWSTTMNMRISLVSQALKLPERATIGLSILNPLTGIDAMVHGSNNLHGWGAPSVVDPTLLYVRGFGCNAVTSVCDFTYDVNPRFGSSRQAAALNLAPVQLTLDVRYDIGPERERQQLALSLRTGRSAKGQKATADALKTRYERAYPNPFEQILRQADTLGLSNDAADSIAVLNKNYSRVIDSIWTPVSKYLADLPDNYNLDEAYEKVRAAENKSIDEVAIYGPAAKTLLTDEQVRKLPPFIAVFLDPNAVRAVRPGMAGGGRGGLFGPGGG